MNALSNDTGRDSDSDFERAVYKRARMAGVRSDWNIFAFESCASTMELATAFLRDRQSQLEGVSEEVNPKAWAAFFSRLQTRGRGRSGRSWDSREGGLYATFLLSGEHESSSRFRHSFNGSINGLSLAMGMAVIRTLRIYDVPASLKWPNDVLVVEKGGAERSKISGVLVDTVYRGDSLRALCIGVGLNVNQRAFPADLQSRSMAQVVDSEFDLASVAGDLLFQIEKMWLSFSETGLGAIVSTLNTSHVFNGEVVSLEIPNGTAGLAGGIRRTLARVIGIQDDGSLLVEDLETGERSVHLNARIQGRQDSVGSNHG